ncbi:hypothetical protein TSMEX_006479, partial [Taenia solium]
MQESQEADTTTRSLREIKCSFKRYVKWVNNGEGCKVCTYPVFVQRCLFSTLTV